MSPNKTVGRGISRGRGNGSSSGRGGPMKRKESFSPPTSTPKRGRGRGSKRPTRASLYYRGSPSKSPIFKQPEDTIETSKPITAAAETDCPSHTSFVTIDFPTPSSVYVKCEESTPIKLDPLSLSLNSSIKDEKVQIDIKNPNNAETQIEIKNPNNEATPDPYGVDETMDEVEMYDFVSSYEEVEYDKSSILPIDESSPCSSLKTDHRRLSSCSFESLSQKDRSRSHSPLASPDPVGVVFELYDEAGLELSFNDYFVSDSHALYENVELSESTSLKAESSANRVRGSKSVRRGGRVGIRGGRAGIRGGRAGIRGGRGSRSKGGWRTGDPLQELWPKDEDVPLELREMASVKKRRHVKVEALNKSKNENSESEDEFEDAIDGRENALLSGEDLHFDWSPMKTFRGVEETFIPQRTGSVVKHSNPYDAFRSYWGDGILQIIVDETNRYAGQIQAANFQADWYPTNVHEVMCLFAFWIMTGVIRMPTISSCFSTNSMLKTEIFSQITTFKRYTNLTRALHFVDTSSTNGDASFGPLYRLKPIIDNLNSTFKSNYVLSKDICIDECSTLWKGNRRFEHIKTKAAKYGFKTLELCESATGYLWSFLVYTGRETTLDSELAKPTAIVRKLVQPLLNKGYRVFMDWFNSPYLARYLKRNGTDCVGTLRPTRVDVPKLVTQVPLEMGQMVARHSGDVCVLSWMDRKRVNMISTCHGSATGLSTVSSKPRYEKFKPHSILDYNRSMGGVDLKDQLEPYLLERNRSKWSMKLFKRLLNVSIHNSRILLESSHNDRADNLVFRLELVQAILNHHHSSIPKARSRQAAIDTTSAFPHLVNHTHWPARIPQSDADLARNRFSRQICVICLREGRKTQRTHYMCETCSVPLCVENCFKKYHTTP